jgi:hypothetical protein
MNRSLAAVLTIAAAVALPSTLSAQGVFPPPPPPGQQGVFPAPPPPGQQGVFPAPPPPGQQSVFPAPPPPGRQGVFPAPQPSGQPGLASAPGGFGPPQEPPPICNSFIKLKDDAEKKAIVIQAIGKNHGDRKAMCAAVTRFAAAETLVVKFLEDNKTTCGVPEQALSTSRTNHDHTLKFRDTVCAEAPAPKPPTLSDAIGTPTLDTAKNTKTGKGTFDTLTGNPLAR